MTKTPHQQRIESFMRTARQEVPAVPAIPPDEVRLLRAKLIFEEAMETITALGVDVVVDQRMGQHGPAVLHDNSYSLILNSKRPPNLLEIADGCADISVVTIGTLSACGISDQPLLETVDGANLRKFGPGSHRREDGKWVKPTDWTPPDIEGVLRQQGWDDGKTQPPDPWARWRWPAWLKAGWIAMDSSGDWHAYEREPWQNEHSWAGIPYSKLSLFDFCPPQGVRWYESKRQNPNAVGAEG
jgi:predicted HAD superfamily Cof-like phosphohydrolase